MFGPKCYYNLPPVVSHASEAFEVTEPSCCHEKFGPPEFCPPRLNISALNRKYLFPLEIFGPMY